jgi:hypothetical protein
VRLCFFQLIGAFYFHTFRNSSGRLAMFAAIRRASARVSNFAPDRRQAR